MEIFMNYFGTNLTQIYLPIFIYYLFGLGYLHWNLNWSIIDSIVITTGSMSAGKDIFSHSPKTRIFFTLFTVIGALLLLNLLSSFIITEVKKARDQIKKSTTVSPVMNVDRIQYQSVWIQRLLVPLLSLTLVLLVGTTFFTFSENWTFTDSLYFCVALRSISGSDDLHAQAMKSKIFLLFYQWIFILSIMNLITSLCALRVEMTELLNLKTQLQRAQNISTLALEPSSFTGENIDQFEFLVKLLIHLEILDPARDVDLWLGAIKGFCQNQSGRLTRGDILAFAESYRRKFLSMDKKNILTPPAAPTTSSQFSRKLSPTSRTIYSPVTNYQSSAHPAAAFEVESPIKDDRTPLLPINSQILRQQQSLSDSPLTLGKKSSYGLFIPPNYQGALAHSPEEHPTYHGLGNHIPYDEVDEESSSL